MTIHFIGAGPGAPDLITIRGRDLIAACPVCLYAGSLVPRALLAHCPPNTRIIDTAPLSLDQIVAEFIRADAAGQNVARLHSGDLSVWSAMGEQLRRLDDLGIRYTVTPGVPSFAASAAVLGQELTLPGLTQSVVLTRTSGRASSMPDREKLATFAATGATLAIHLSIHVLDAVVAELMPHYGPHCPIAIVYRASWPDERVVRGTLSTIAALLEQPYRRVAIQPVDNSPHRNRTTHIPSSWPGMSEPPIAAGGGIGGPDTPGHNDKGAHDDEGGHGEVGSPDGEGGRDERKGHSGPAAQGHLSGEPQTPPADPSQQRTAMILVGPVLGAQDFRDSALYDPDYHRRFRPVRTPASDQ
jgi:precorrin-4/cobalt-precorrin-4 C11-methyltransferase